MKCGDDSSGNAGASPARHAACWLRSIIFVPHAVPEPKKAQITIYGGELVEVPGPRADATKAAEAMTYNSREMAMPPTPASRFSPRPDDRRLGNLGAAWPHRAGLADRRRSAMAARCWGRGAAFNTCASRASFQASRRG